MSTPAVTVARRSKREFEALKFETRFVKPKPFIGSLPGFPRAGLESATASTISPMAEPPASPRATAVPVSPRPFQLGLKLAISAPLQGVGEESPFTPRTATALRDFKNMPADESVSLSKHFYTEEELAGLVDYVNNALNTTFDPKSEAIFDEIRKGMIMGNLLTTIEPTALSRPLSTKNSPFEVLENHKLVLEGAKKVGCTIINISELDLRDGTPHLVLGVLWQLVRAGLLKQVQKLARDVMGLPPEQILLQWLNMHARNTGYTKTVMNFSGDLRDGEVLLRVLHGIAPSLTPKDCWLEITDPTARAQRILEIADQLGCKKFVSVSDIVNGNGRLLLAFVATLFTAFPDMGEKTRVANLEQEVGRMKLENENLKRELFTAMTDAFSTDEEYQTKLQEQAKLHELDIQAIANKYEKTIEMLKRTFQQEMERERSECARQLDEMRKKLEDQLERERKLKIAILGEDMQGFLHKKGKGSGKMQRRLFYLRGEYILYFKEVNELSKPKGSIYIINVKVSMLDETTTIQYTGSKSLKWGFELHSTEQNRVYLVVAESEELRKNWMSAIKSNQRRYIARQQVQNSLDTPLIVK